MGLAALRKIQAGKETTAGTAVAATSQYMGMTLTTNLDDRTIVQPDDERGSLAGSHRSYTPTQLWQGTISGNVTYEDLPYLLRMAIKGAVTPSTVDTSARLWTYAPSLTAANVPDTNTLEMGDDTQEYESEYVFATDLEISGSIEDALKFRATLVGRQLAASTFTGALAARTVEDAIAAKTKIYIDDTGGTIGTTQKTLTLIDWTWKLPAHFVVKRHQDGNLYFSGYSEVKMKPTLEIVCEMNSTVVTLRTKHTAETRQLVRLRTSGSLCGAATAVREVTSDGAYKIVSMGSFDERSGANIVRLRLEGEYDATWAKLFEIQAQNAVATLP